MTDLLEHIQSLKLNISKYFSEDNSKIKSIINPFDEDYMKKISKVILQNKSFIDLTK